MHVSTKRWVIPSGRIGLDDVEMGREQQGWQQGQRLESHLPGAPTEAQAAAAEPPAPPHLPPDEGLGAPVLDPLFFPKRWRRLLQFLMLLRVKIVLNLSNMILKVEKVLAA